MDNIAKTMEETQQQSSLKLHREAGRFFEAGGIRSFVREEGPNDGDIVLCLHGGISSSYLYRKVLKELSQRRYRAIAIDIPGLGLSDRIENFDYTWTGLGSWLCKATETLQLLKFHLIVHDLGGPIGFELIAKHPERILSLTILDTLLEVSKFQKPFMMRPYEWNLTGSIAMSLTTLPFMLNIMMKIIGIHNTNELTYEDIETYTKLLQHQDNGQAFLKILRNFEITKEKEDLYVNSIQKLTIPKQMIWGKCDILLPIHEFARPIKQGLNITRYLEVPSKHFLQEDNYKEISKLIDEMIKE